MAHSGFTGPTSTCCRPCTRLPALCSSRFTYPIPDQTSLTIVVLGLSTRTDDLADFVFLFIASAVTAILISAPVPALNSLIDFDVFDPHRHAFVALREGAMGHFDLDQGQGLTL